MFVASSHDSLVDVDHGDKLGLLLEQLVEQGTIAPTKDQQVLLCIVLQEMTLTLPQDSSSLHATRSVKVQKLKMFSQPILGFSSAQLLFNGHICHRRQYFHIS